MQDCSGGFARGMAGFRGLTSYLEICTRSRKYNKALIGYLCYHLSPIEKFTKTGKVLHRSTFPIPRKVLILMERMFGQQGAIDKADEVAHRVTRMRISARVRLPE